MYFPQEISPPPLLSSFPFPTNPSYPPPPPRLRNASSVNSIRAQTSWRRRRRRRNETSRFSGIASRFQPKVSPLRLPSEFLVRGVTLLATNIFPLQNRIREEEEERGIRPIPTIPPSISMLHPCQKGARGVLSSVIVGGPIIMRLIQIDDCRRLFARSLRICEWRRIIRATLRRSHAALHVGLIFNRRCVQNAGRYARTGSRAKPPPSCRQ